METRNFTSVGRVSDIEVDAYSCSISREIGTRYTNDHWCGILKSGYTFFVGYIGNKRFVFIKSRSASCNLIDGGYIFGGKQKTINAPNLKTTYFDKFVETSEMMKLFKKKKLLIFDNALKFPNEDELNVYIKKCFRKRGEIMNPLTEGKTLGCMKTHKGESTRPIKPPPAPTPVLKKTVALPIEVPNCDWCMEPTQPYRICQYFDNEGGHPRCELSPCYNLKYSEKTGGVRKPIECRTLKEI